MSHSSSKVAVFSFMLTSFMLPQIFFDIAGEIGLLSPTVIYDGLADVTLYIGRQWTGAVMVLVVAFAGINIDEVVLDGTLYATGHIVIDGGESDGQTNGLIITVLWTIFSLHLGIKQVDASDIDSILGFITGKNTVEAMLTKRASFTEANGVVVCLFCEDLFAGLWSVLFLLHSCHF